MNYNRLLVEDRGFARQGLFFNVPRAVIRLGRCVNYKTQLIYESIKSEWLFCKNTYILVKDETWTEFRHVSFILSTFSVPISNSTKTMNCTFDYNIQRIFAKIHLRLYPINVLQSERDRRALIQKKRRGTPPCTTFMDSKRLCKTETSYRFTNLLSPALYTVRISLLRVWKFPTSICYTISPPPWLNRP